MNIRPMENRDKETVLNMVDAMYNSAAVDHRVASSVLERAFYDAVGANPYVKGYLIEIDGCAAGYVYLIFTYSCEVAGNVVMIEEFFVDKKFRGNGVGQMFLDWLFDEFPDTKRFRLEVTEHNRATHLYKRNGFKYLDYNQMIYDKK